MGSLRRKRRKKLAKAWGEFQAKHELTDAELKYARSAGYELERLLQTLATVEFRDLPIRKAIALARGQREQQLVTRREQISAGTKKPKAKKKKTVKHDPEWVKAKRQCRLNQDDIRKAKELGLKPKSLIKNIPNSKQQWKLPVKHWIAELYEKRFAGKTTPRPLATSRDRQIQRRLATALDAYLAGDFAALHAFECERNRIDLDAYEA